MQEKPLRGRWSIAPESGAMHIDAGRFGPLVLRAVAPIAGGAGVFGARRHELELLVAISRAHTGNPLLDAEARALVRRGSDGFLTFSGSGRPDQGEIDFVGHASAGRIQVPLTLTGMAEVVSQRRASLELSGSAVFERVHIPLPGFSGMTHMTVQISGTVTLVAQEAPGRRM